MMVDEFYNQFKMEVMKMDIDPEDKVLILQRVANFLQEKREVNKHDIDFIKKLIIPSVIWRNW